MEKKQTFVNFATKIAEEAGKRLLKEFYKLERVISSKTTGGIVTPYDIKSDLFIRNKICSSFPDHSYLTEETGFVDKKSRYLWVIDPLDGTGNFVNHDPFFAVSIALFKNGIPVLGVIEAPALNERYVAEKGKGSFIINTKTNKKYSVRTSNVRTLAQAFILYCKGGEKRSVMIKDVNMRKKLFVTLLVIISNLTIMAQGIRGKGGEPSDFDDVPCLSLGTYIIIFAVVIGIPWLIYSYKKSKKEEKERDDYWRNKK